MPRQKRSKPYFHALGHDEAPIDIKAACDPSVNSYGPRSNRQLRTWLGVVWSSRRPPGHLQWHSFPSRAVITRETAKIPRALRPVGRRGELETRIDQDFESIVDSCRAGRTDWPWITPALIDVYREVQELGFVRTVGDCRDGELVGGLWGIEVGGVLGIMSMFHRENNGDRSRSEP